MNGSWTIVPVMFPVLVALLPMIFRKQWVRIIATVVLGGFVLIGGFSIGFFYLPAGVLMLLAACVEDSAKFRDLF
jgi:general stress protein CsbA